MSTPPTTAPPGGSNDWQNDLLLTESNRYMLDNQVDCDVWFTLLPSGGAAELPVTVGAHRYMLVSRSPVFYAMLSGPLAARTTQPSPSQHRRQPEVDRNRVFQFRQKPKPEPRFSDICH